MVLAKGVWPQGEGEVGGGECSSNEACHNERKKKKKKRMVVKFLSRDIFSFIYGLCNKSASLQFPFTIFLHISVK